MRAFLVDNSTSKVFFFLTDFIIFRYSISNHDFAVVMLRS